VLPLARRLWEHSVGCAVLCRGLSRRIHRDEETHFVAGLLHDIGKVPILEAVREVSRAANQSRLPSEEIFTYIFDSWHESIGQRVAEAWSLPEEIVDVVGCHHLRADRALEPSNALVAVANHLCHTSGDIEALGGFEGVDSAGLTEAVLEDFAAGLPEMAEEIAERLG
jgi:putative nucleotidyltransferase with HDIG domain